MKGSIYRIWGTSLVLMALSNCALKTNTDCGIGVSGGREAGKWLGELELAGAWDSTDIPDPDLLVGYSGSSFVDARGRELLLRGINVSGSCKLPVHEPGGIPTFVGHPFPLSESREHFARLRGMGFHVVRLLTTWEAVEPVAPGRYDEEYLAYYRKLVESAGKEGLRVVVDPHQDVWSRATGGSGAPKWTLRLAGMDPDRLESAGAVLFSNQYAENTAGGVWLANHERLACATMFTLFFGGDRFAPKLKDPNGGSLQSFLQDCFIGAMARLALELKDCRNVVGIGVMNEPGRGFIGVRNLSNLGVFTLDVAMTPAQGMAAGAGVPTKVRRFRLGALGPQMMKSVVVNPEEVSVWTRPGGCPWRENGVWSPGKGGQPLVHKSSYFRGVDFANDHYRPFVERYAAALRGVNPDYLIFVETPVLGKLPDWDGDAPEGIVDGSHWYDVATVVTRCHQKHLSVDKDARILIFGSGSVLRMFDRQIGRMLDETDDCLGRRPLWISEFGVPFNGDCGKPWSDYSDESKALDNYFEAMESRGTSYALWQYQPTSNQSDGDGWNEEEFSIWSADLKGGRGGFRVKQTVARPYPYAVQGRLSCSRFDSGTGRYSMSFRSSSSESDAPTLIFLPEAHYGEGFEVRVSGPGRLSFSELHRMLVFKAERANRSYSIEVRP